MTASETSSPREQMSAPSDIAQLIQTVLLPNNAAVGQVLVNRCAEVML